MIRVDDTGSQGESVQSPLALPRTQTSFVEALFVEEITPPKIVNLLLAELYTAVWSDRASGKSVVDDAI
jgi:hypothetical protein